MIGSFTLVSWGTLGLFWDTREHNKGHFEVQAWISTDFWCYLACLEPLLWRPGGPWDDLGTLGSITKDTLRSMLGFPVIFDGLRESILRAF